ncbi:cytochrome c biogenesis protein CcsA [bacterium]|nr:cytochrome c biogenesis protein CcsA [bacterium]
MKIIRFFFSMQFMIILSGIYAVALGAATFIEDTYDTQTARALIYNSRWLEVLYLFLLTNLIANIIRFRLWRREKWLIGLFHTAFILILIGAAITRYSGYRGLLHFREGETTGRLLSDKAYLSIQATKGDKTETNTFPLMLSAMTDNPWQKSIKTGSKSLHIHLNQYLPKAVPNVVENLQGGPVITLTVSLDDDRPVPLYLRPGEHEKIDQILFAFEEPKTFQDTYISITLINNQPTIRSNEALSVIDMKNRKHMFLPVNQSTMLESGLLFQQKNVRFALHSYTPHGMITAVPVENNFSGTESYSAIILNISGKSKTHQVTLFGGPDMEGVPEKIIIDGTEFAFTYGSLVTTLPFQLRLNDFIIERYPGSRMPSTYESQVTIIDSESEVEKSYRIYMNHILKYHGFRFYQTSYDEDEKGSILSVARDPGTPMTYVGYAILMICLFLNLFNPKSRFQKIGCLLRTVFMLTLIVLLFPLNHLYARNSVDFNFYINPHHAGQFTKLMVQDERGRMKPVHSMAKELLRDLDHPEQALSLSPSQWILFVYTHPESIQNLPMIPLVHTEINNRLGISSKSKFAPPSVFYSKNGKFLLENWVRRAESVSKHSRSNLDKAVLKTQDQLKLIQYIRAGGLFRLFPMPKNPDRWISDTDERLEPLTGSLIHDYKQAIRSSQWSMADQLLNKIDIYQQKHGKAILPSILRRDVEIFYNEINIFQRLSPYFLWSGILLFVWMTIIIIKPEWRIETVSKILTGLLLIGFGLQTTGLILRWIASAHAPWTNKYESMIYITWTIMFSGVIFLKNSRFPISLAAVLSSGVLRAAHMPWADPGITNLIPVLKSHWLLTHVSVITASYGFFSLSAILGMFTLTMISFSEKNNYSTRLIQRLTWINERSMIIGLTLVTIGNLLGAIWANESWGRYWGWDPKETWTLIVILTYAIILHLRLISGISVVLSINIGSTLGIWTVLMTYIGVNFYLSGIHSYAAGEASPLPNVIYIIMGLQLLMSITATVRVRKGWNF